MLRSITLILVMGVVITGCSQKAISPLSDELTETQAQAELEGTIANSPYFSLSGQEDSNSTQTEEQAPPYLGLQLNPAPTNKGWFRRLDWTTFKRTIKIVSLDIENGLADIEVSLEISGILRIAKTWLHALGGTYITNKPFIHYMRRRARFERIAPGEWRLQAITPLYVSYRPLDQIPEISIKSVKVYDMDNNGQLILSVTNYDTMYDRNTIPTLKPSQNIKVELEITSPAGVTNVCYLHHHIIFRDIMYDDGSTSGDTVSGDNVYTRTYTVGTTTGIYHAWFDVIKKETIDGNEIYSSVIWGIPYKVE